MKISNEKVLLAFGAGLLLLIVTAFSYSSRHHVNMIPEVSSNSKPFDFYPRAENTFQNRPAFEFIYDIDSRYLMNITKSDIEKLRSISDLIPLNENESTTSVLSVDISILDDNYKAVAIETGNSDLFNAAQLTLLQRAPYSSNILISTRYHEKNNKTGLITTKGATPHITIIPEKEAQYESGKEVLIKYLKENSKDKIGDVTTDRLRSGKVYFTVTDKGTITNIRLLSTSGYKSIDNIMLELISKIPGTWEPGTNEMGENVSQELVFSFGTMGC